MTRKYVEYKELGENTVNKWMIQSFNSYQQYGVSYFWNYCNLISLAMSYVKVKCII